LIETACARLGPPHLSAEELLRAYNESMAKLNS
jgi:hypothetical protein